jgi:APA family basic amino acid/polyamine antiporter
MPLPALIPDATPGRLSLAGNTPQLQRAVGPSGFFTLALGAMVGSGWVVVLGDWLLAAGPGGAIMGFLAGGVTMILIALCYGELAARSARAGGEFLFVRETLGRGPAFLIGWFLTLFAVAVCAFESVVLGALMHALFPSVGSTPLYRIGGTPIETGSVGIGVLGAILIGFLHARGAASAIRFQNVVTCGFLFLMIVLVGLGIGFGSMKNLTPAFQSMDGRPWLHGAVWVFSLCAFFLNGWQSAIHALEERRAGVDVRQAIRAIVAGIVAATLIYCGIILSAASSAPWRQIAAQPMPARAAFDLLLPGWPLGTLVLATAAVSVAKTWSAVAWLGSRLIVALSRDGLLPRPLAALDAATGSPRRAILLVTALSLGGPAFGRSALLPLVDMVSVCLALSILLCLIVLINQRRIALQPSTYRVPGGLVTVWIAFLLALLMIGTAIISPVLEHPGHIPVEWLLMAAWALVGGVYFWACAPAHPAAHPPPLSG